MKILVINTGSTSTKLAVFEDERELCSRSMEHSAQELAAVPNVLDQLPMRRQAVLDFLAASGFAPGDIDVIASRGGAFAIFKGGAYEIDGAIADLASRPRPGFTPNGSWLAALISYGLAQDWGIKAYFYNAVFTDELCSFARYSGISFIPRRAGGHPLNCKEVARREALRLGRPVEDCTFVICHMGGGISSELHCCGRITDVISFTEGAFTPERAGRVPSNALIDLFYSNRFADKRSFMKFMRGRGGLVDYLGTNSVLEVERRIATGDRHAEEVLHAMCYQIAKDIGAVAAAACGKVDGILLTSGIAHSERVTAWIRERVEFIAPVSVYAGGFEMEALAGGICRVCSGLEPVNRYEPTEEGRAAQ